MSNPRSIIIPRDFHLFLSFFDERRYQKLQILSPVVDILTGIAIFIFCYAYINFLIAIISTTLYVVTPFVLDNAYSFNPRSFANLFFVLTVFSCINTVLFNSITWLCVSVIFLCISPPAAQTDNTMPLPYSGHTRYRSAISTSENHLLLSIVAAIIVTKGFYLNVLWGHLAFISEFGHKAFNDKYQDERPALFPDPKQLLFNMPIFLVLLLVVFYPLNLQDPYVYSFLMWALALTLLSIIWVFGEGIRHMICSVWSFSILTALVVTSYHLYSVFLILMVVSIFFSLYKIYLWEKYPHISGITTKNMLRAFDL